MLIFHIIVALASIAFTGFTYFNPSKQKLNISYVLVGATLATGTYLVFFGHANLVKTCYTGLIYLGFVTLGLVAAHKRLVKEPSAE